MRQDSKLIHVIAFVKQAFGLCSLDSLAMCTLAVVSELPVILVRATLVFALSAMILVASGHSPGSGTVWIEVGLLPAFWSIVALATPFGTGWWWKQRTGGRRPSARELATYDDSMEILRSHARDPLPLPKSWFVLDTPTLDAAVCGETLMLSRGLLQSDHLPAVLAHELGHLATSDGKLTAAINRLVLIPPRPRRTQQTGYEHDGREHGIVIADQRIVVSLFGLGILRWAVRTTLRFVNGGFGLWLTSPLWSAYWRGREYKADAYAASLGQADELADFLETHALIHDHPVPYIWLTEHTHPPAELRIDKLSALSQSQAGVAGSGAL